MALILKIQTIWKNGEDKILKYILSYKFFYKRFLFIEITTFDVHISKLKLS